jgi:hypothetical protein
MKFRFLGQSVKNIIFNPIKEWEAVINENRPVKFISRNLTLPLIICASISAFLGSYLFANTELSKGYSVLTGVRYFILICLVIWGTAFIFEEIANIFNPGMTFKVSFKLVAYSSVPFLLCQIISQLFESFIFVNVLAFFGLYIFWTGHEKMADPSEKNKPLLMVAATVTFIILFLVFNWLLTLIFDKLYFSVFA